MRYIKLSINEAEFLSSFISNSLFSLLKKEQGLSEQESKHAHFCIKCNYLHIVTSNWTKSSFTNADFTSYQSMCSGLFKLPCARNNRTKCTRRIPVPQMGALHGEWHIHLHILPTTQCLCSIAFAIILIYYENPRTPKITQFGALAGQIQHMAAQQVGFTPRLIRYGHPN